MTGGDSKGGAKEDMQRMGSRPNSHWLPDQAGAAGQVLHLRRNRLLPGHLQ